MAKEVPTLSDKEKDAKKNRRNNQRLFLNRALDVEMCSIGGLVKYTLQTRNISHTGLFLDFEKPGRFPFTPSSIMEVWLKIPDSEIVFFNGKMARVVYPEDEHVRLTGPGIGIRIIQIDKENEERLNRFLYDLDPQLIRKPGAA